MDELFARQIAILRTLIEDYRKREIGLNALIQRIEGIGSVLGIEAWSNAVFPIVLSMEQMNATALDGKREPTASERTSIEGSLLELEALIARFEAKF